MKIKNIIPISFSVLIFFSCVTRQKTVRNSMPSQEMYFDAFDVTLAYLKETNWIRENETIKIYNKIILDTTECITYGIANFGYHRTCLSEATSSEEKCKMSKKYYQSIHELRGYSKDFNMDINKFCIPFELVSIKKQFDVFVFSPLIKKSDSYYKILISKYDPSHGTSVGIEIFLEYENNKFKVTQDLWRDSCTGFTLERDYLRDFN